MDLQLEGKRALVSGRYGRHAIATALAREGACGGVIRSAF